MTNLNEKLSYYKNIVKEFLSEVLPSKDCDQKNVIEAMEYSLLSNGKRIRPALMFGFCSACGGDYKKALPFAAAIEMIHAYSLIHDDLPCMDNDDMRRGKPSNHIVFGETIALLAGDGLLNLAFETSIKANAYNKEKISDSALIKSIEVLSNASGVLGMIGGQVIDLQSEGKQIDIDTILKIHSLKTGALIKAACKIGCIIGLDGNIETEQGKKYLESAEIYGGDIGLVFQIIDDILDCTSSEEVLGKPIKSDEEQQKTTYVDIYGIEKSMEIAREITANAKKSLDVFPLNDKILYDMADMLLNREK